MMELLSALFGNDDGYGHFLCLKAGYHAQVKACEEFKKEQEAQHDQSI